MDYVMKLPQNKKEFIIFMTIVSILSVNIIAPLITCFELEFCLAVWLDTLKVIPFLWLAVILLVLITHKPAEYLASLYTKNGDSFSACVLINILFNVLLMSCALTVIGTWIGTRQISLEPFRLFFYKWPRNFSISFFVEACIAQPFARYVIFQLHVRQKSSIET